ncbi:hypothetical protein HZA86_05645 [Candidatus Uhrbacteria bacterium]|nr:hypothetical protein [Candidatus Uhrbacteria bacterium]
MEKSATDQWMPGPEDPGVLQKTAISERGREQLIAGLKEVARGLRLFERAREQAEPLPQDDTPTELSPLSAVAIAQAEAGLFAQALKTHPPSVSPSESCWDLVTPRIAKIMAEYGFGGWALPLIEKMAPAVKGTEAESNRLLNVLRVIADAQQQAGESTERTRTLMVQIIKDGRESFMSHLNRVEWCLQYGLAEEAGQFLDEIKDPTERESFSVRIALAQYVRKPGSGALKTLIAAMKRSSNAIVIREALHQFAEVGDTSAIQTIESALLYSGWLTWIIGVSDTNIGVNDEDINAARAIAEMYRGNRSKADDALGLITNPVYQRDVLLKMARIELAKGDIDAASQRIPTIEKLSPLAYEEIKQLEIGCVAKAIEIKQFVVAKLLLNKVHDPSARSTLLQQYAIAFGQSGGEIENELQQLREQRWQTLESNRIDVLNVYLAIGRFKDAETLIGALLRFRMNKEDYTHRLALAFLAHDQLESATRLLTKIRSSKYRDAVLEGIAEFHAEHGVEMDISTVVDAMSAPEAKCRALANAGKIFVHKGLAPEEIYEMTIAQAKAVVLGGDTEAIGALKILRPDIIERLEKSPDIKK